MTRKICVRELFGCIKRQSDRHAKNVAFRKQVHDSEKIFDKCHKGLIELICSHGATTGNPLTDALLVVGGIAPSEVEDVLEKVSRQFSNRVGAPALFVLHTQEGDENHCVLLLGVLNDKKFVVNGREGICAPPFINEASTVDFSAMDISIAKVGSNLLQEFVRIEDITSKNLKCHIGIHQIIHWFRKYGGGTKGLITLYLMAKQIGMELPEIEELHPTLVDALDIVLDPCRSPGECSLGHRILFFVDGKQEHVDL